MDQLRNVAAQTEGWAGEGVTPRVSGVDGCFVCRGKYPSEMHSRGEAQGCGARGTCDLSWGGAGEEQMNTG